MPLLFLFIFKVGVLITFTGHPKQSYLLDLLFVAVDGVVHELAALFDEESSLVESKCGVGTLRHLGKYIRLHHARHHHGVVLNHHIRHAVEQ